MKFEVTNSQPEELCVDPHPASNRQRWRGGGRLLLDWRVPYGGRIHELEIWILKSTRPGGRYYYYLPGSRPIWYPQCLGEKLCTAWHMLGVNKYLSEKVNGYAVHLKLILKVNCN